MKASEMPNALFFLKFGHVPNILVGGSDQDTSVIHPWIFAEKSTLVGKDGWTVGNFDAFAFARLLAKIGHCLARTQTSFEFSPLALDFIFGRTENLSSVVGGSLVDSPPAETLHWMRLNDYFNQETGRRFVVAQIRLFASLGAPTYYVAVGEVPWDAKLLNKG